MRDGDSVLVEVALRQSVVVIESVPVPDTERVGETVGVGDSEPLTDPLRVMLPLDDVLRLREGDGVEDSVPLTVEVVEGEKAPDAEGVVLGLRVKDPLDVDDRLELTVCDSEKVGEAVTEGLGE